jgi:antibiotic biosynthesis monooxygenase (ABM) superfamily enzyme
MSDLGVRPTGPGEASASQAAERIDNEGATAVITHRVRHDKHPQYELWLQEIGPVCRAAQGHLDLHVIRPISGLTETYTVIIRFDTEANLRAWIESPTRNTLIDKVSPLLVKGDDVVISGGLDFWFAPQQGQAKIPIKWKQYLVTWSAIYPLVLVVPMLVLPLLRRLGLPEHRYTDVLVITAIIVGLMVYVVMPRYTKLIQRWLYA